MPAYDAAWKALAYGIHDATGWSSRQLARLERKDITLLVDCSGFDVESNGERVRVESGELFILAFRWLGHRSIDSEPALFVSQRLEPVPHKVPASYSTIARAIRARGE